MESKSELFYVFILALSTRLIAIPTSILRVNPYSQADARGFENAASLIAQRLSSFQYPFFDLVGYSSTYETWGAILAPFWLIPGPSIIYAHIFVSALGAGAVYNIGWIGQWYHSNRAGVFAALPFIFYPSIILTHSTLLREAAVLFGITYAARLLISLPHGSRKSIIIAALSLVFVTLQRPENLPLYVGTIVIGFFAILLRQNEKIRKASPFIASLSVISVIPFLSSAIDKLLEIRDYRATGRTAYLEQVSFGSVFDLIVFSWIGALYFLFSPFPWMISTVSDLIVGIESIISILLTIFVLFGLRIGLKRNPIVTVTLLIGFLTAVVFYGYGSVNVGTAVRHRPMFMWVWFLFGGVGLANRLVIRV